jgi:hypothetical protein
MSAQLQAIERRRAALGREIGQTRAAQRQALSAVRQELAVAGLGLVIGRLLVRRPWLRAAVMAGVAAVAARRLGTRG